VTERAPLLDRPVRRAVVDVALTLLDAARTASGRLDDPDDTEALHDFRVALRRLRTLLRAFRAQLDDAVSKKLQRRLRDVTRSTSRTRDAEVQLAWINDQRPALGKRAGPGVPWLVARLTEHRDKGYAKARSDGVAQFRRLDRRLRRALSTALLAPAVDGPTLAVATAQTIREQTATLEHEVRAAHSPRDVEAIHGARIAGKRLRYVLEPIVSDAPEIAPLVKQLRQIQDLLGELHDVQVLLADLGNAVAEAAAEHARGLHEAAVADAAKGQRKRRTGPRAGSAGLLALARHARTTQDELFHRLETEWGGSGQLASLTGALNAFADALVARAAPPSPQSPPIRHGTRRARQLPPRRRVVPGTSSPEVA